MIEQNEKYEVHRSILKCDYIRYSPSERSTINTAYSQNCLIIPREDSFISLISSYLDLYFDAFYAATGNRYVDNIDIRFVNLRPIALFSRYKLTTSSGKHVAHASHGYIVSLMQKLITSAENTDDLSIGFGRDRGRRQRELTNNKNIKGKNHVRIRFSVDFWFCRAIKKS